jgi:UDP-N-acetylglucosamine acyltransferase
MIHPNAIVDPSAKIAKGAEIGPFAIIGPNVEIGAGTRVAHHAVIKRCTRIGRDNQIFQFSSLGDDPQDKKYQGEETYLEIGDCNVFREFCTVNRGTVLDQSVTKIGNDNLLMCYSHVAHDCRIGNNTILANNASLCGHVQVDNYAILSGFSAVFQRCRIGEHSFLCGNAIAIRDVLPFSKVAGVYAKPFGLNTVGLQRSGFDKKTRTILKIGYRIIYRQHLSTQEAIKKLKDLMIECPEISKYIEFLENSKSGIVR